METIIFMTSLLTFYLKGEIKQEQNFISFKIPNTILTFIPLGAKKQTIPINQIASVSTDFHLLLKPFLIGIIVAFAGLLEMLTDFLIGAILLLIGVVMVINSFQTLLNVNTTSGGVTQISFLIFQKSLAEKAESQINALIGGRLDDTNVRVQNVNLMNQNVEQTNRIIDAINNNNNNRNNNNEDAAQ